MSKSYQEIADFATGTCAGIAVSSAGFLTLDGTGLLSGTDTAGRYHGGEYLYGRFTSATLPVSCTEVIASMQANTAPGTWIELELSAEVEGVWSKWYSMGVWLQEDLPFRRHSINGQGDARGTVATDTLILKNAATAVKARVTLCTLDPAHTPVVRSLGLAFSNGKDQAGVVPSTGLVSDLNVPKRSQMVFPNGGNVWCSPTSLTMVMEYWSIITGDARLNQSVPAVVAGVWDYTYDGAGNWPYNTNYAASFGLQAKVARMSSLAEVEVWTAAGVPVIVSVAYQEGQMEHTPIPSTAGHILIVRGFTEAGDVLTNDPAAASDAEVGILYNRLQFEHAWLDKANGTTYLIYPSCWAIPETTNRHW